MQFVPRFFPRVLGILVLGLALSACPQGGSLEVGGADVVDDDDGLGEGGQSPAECEGPSSCEATASTCCECPSFAVPTGSGFEEGCSDVECGPMADCPAVEPVCNSGRCELVCAVIEITSSCEDGFEVDVFGCLVDSCAVRNDDSPTCNDDVECTQVPADCCGCARGGFDTAVPLGQEEQFSANLDCPAQPRCPDVSVCDPSEEPRCLAGRCRLLPVGGDPESSEGQLCGSPDLESCPEGSACVLNYPDALQANTAGLGSCQAL